MENLKSLFTSNSPVVCEKLWKNVCLVINLNENEIFGMVNNENERHSVRYTTINIFFLFFLDSVLNFHVLLLLLLRNAIATKQHDIDDKMRKKEKQGNKKKDWERDRTGESVSTFTLWWNSLHCESFANVFDFIHLVFCFCFLQIFFITNTRWIEIRTQTAVF